MQELDNPGKGDCLFYSLSAGLIHSIQTNPDKEQAKALWDRWVALGRFSEIDKKTISFNEIEQLNLTADPKEKTDLKNRLQISLRRITAEAMNKRSEDLFFSQCKPESEQYKSRQYQLSKLNDQLKAHDSLFQQVELLEKPAHLLQIEINKIRENNGYKENKDTEELNAQRLALLGKIKTEPAFIELKVMQNSEEISALRNLKSLLTANQLEHDPVYINFRNLVDFYKTPNNNQSLAHNIFQYSQEVKNLARDLAKNNASEKDILEAMTQEKIRDILTQGVNEIKKRYVWGNAEHAACVLTALEVNSSIQKKGEGIVKLDKSFGEHAPIVKIINIADAHWVTDLDSHEVTLHITCESEGVRLFLNDSNSNSLEPNFLSIPKLSTLYPDPRNPDFEKRPLSRINPEEFFAAAFKGDIAYVRNYIKDHKNTPHAINVCNTNRDTALILAASEGHFLVVRDLLTAGAFVNACNFYGDTALIWAATNGHLPVVKALFSAGATINAYNENGDSAIIGAIRNKNLDVVHFLVNNGAILTQMNLKGLNAEQVAYEAVSKLTYVSPLDKTAKEEALELRVLAILAIIQNALFLQAAKEGNLEFIQIFIEAFGKDLSRLNYADQDGNTALILAAKSGHISIVKKLISNDADFTHRNWKRHTAEEETQSPYIKNFLQQVAFFYAAETGNVEGIKKYIAAHQEHPETAINVSDANGNTALMVAADNGHREVVQLLINEGADITQRNYYRCTAKEITHYPAIRELLEKEQLYKKSLNKMIHYFDDLLSIYNLYHDTNLSRNHFKKANLQLLALDMLADNNKDFLSHVFRNFFHINIKQDSKDVIHLRDSYLHHLKITFVRMAINESIKTRKLACLVDNLASGFEREIFPQALHAIHLLLQLDTLLEEHPSDIHLGSYLRNIKSQFTQNIIDPSQMQNLVSSLEYRVANDSSIRQIIQILQKLDAILQTNPKDKSLHSFINSNRNQFATTIQNRRPLEHVLAVLEIRLENERNKIVAIPKSRSLFFKSAESHSSELFSEYGRSSSDEKQVYRQTDAKLQADCGGCTMM